MILAHPTTAGTTHHSLALRDNSIFSAVATSYQCLRQFCTPGMRDSLDLASQPSGHRHIDGR